MQKLYSGKAKKLGLIEETAEDILLLNTSNHISNLHSKLNSIQDSLFKKVDFNNSYFPSSWTRLPKYKDALSKEKQNQIIEEENKIKEKNIFKKINIIKTKKLEKQKKEQKVTIKENEMLNRTSRLFQKSKEKNSINDVLDFKSIGNFNYPQLKYPDLDKINLTHYIKDNNGTIHNKSLIINNESTSEIKKASIKESNKAPFTKVNAEYEIRRASFLNKNIRNNQPLKKKPTINTIHSVKNTLSDESDMILDDNIDQLSLLKGRFQSEKERNKYLNFFTKPKRKINYLILKTGDYTIDERNLNIHKKINKEMEIKPEFPQRIKKLSNEVHNKNTFHFLSNRVNKDTFSFNNKIMNLLCEKDFHGPFFSHCNTCLTRNLNYYSGLSINDAENIIKLIK